MATKFIAPKLTNNLFVIEKFIQPWLFLQLI